MAPSNPLLPLQPMAPTRKRSLPCPSHHHIYSILPFVLTSCLRCVSKSLHIWCTHSKTTPPGFQGFLHINMVHAERTCMNKAGPSPSPHTTPSFVPIAMLCFLYNGYFSHVHYCTHEAQPPSNATHSQHIGTWVTITLWKHQHLKFTWKPCYGTGWLQSTRKPGRTEIPCLRKLEALPLHFNSTTLSLKLNSCSHVSMISQMFPQNSLPPHV